MAMGLENSGVNTKKALARENQRLQKKAALPRQMSEPAPII
jgi:hypothetical protein